MPVSKPDRAVVEDLFRAMQDGPLGEERMMALFAADAELIEPFSGVPRRHLGHDAIRAAFRGTWENPAPELRLVLDRVDVDGEAVRAEWTCTSPVFQAPMRGVDLFTIRDGKIVRLEIRMVEEPS